MSEEKIFGNSVITSSDELDQDFDLDSNGLEMDPDNESIFDFNDVPVEEDPYSSMPLDTEHLFKQEPLDNAEMGTEFQNRTALDETVEPEKKPRKSSKKPLIITAVIVLILCAALGGYGIAYLMKERSTPTTPTKTEDTVKEETPVYNDTTNIKEDNNYYTDTTPNTPAPSTPSTDSTTENTDQNTDTTTDSTPDIVDAPEDAPPQDYDLEPEDEGYLKDYGEPDYANRTDPYAEQNVDSGN